MVKDFPECNLEVKFYEHSMYGKKIRVRCPFGATREKGILELVHNNVFGPVSVPSLGGSLYYVSFIDDISRTTWIYLLRKKSKVFNKFKEFKSLVENQKNKKCWLWSLIIFLIHRFVSTVLGPHSLTRWCGVDLPPTTVARGGDDNFCSPPMAGDSGLAPPKRNIGEIAL
jgi:hypothetical protein